MTRVTSGSPPGLASATQLLSDERLARRATKGDRQAFEAIFRRYHQDLYRFCLAMAGNPQDAQDALQNTMVKVLRALPGEERQIQLKPWLYRIARNEVVEILRRRRSSAELEPDLIASGWEISQAAEDRERLRRLLADLEELPARQRAALVMRELAGFDFAQIGEAFGSSAGVARQTLYEARLSLRQIAEGREMRCEAVTRELSDADGRVTRRREIRAHLRDCADCRAFRDEIAARRGELAAIAPLPLAASAGLLHGILGAQANAAVGGGAGAAATATGAGVGKTVATSAIVKSAATVAVATALGVSAADRSGLIELPLPVGSHHSSAQGASGPYGAPAGSDAVGGAGAASGSPGTSTGPKGKSAAHDEGRGAEAGHTGDGGSTAHRNAAPSGSSRSQAGLNPPGGGHGGSAAGRHGRPERLPAASGHGQQTATAHKHAHAASPPRKGAAHRGHKKSSGGGASPPAKPAPAHAQAPAGASPAPQPPAEAPSRRENGPVEPAGDDAQQALES